jgi:hypothetical protein
MVMVAPRQAPAQPHRPVVTVAAQHGAAGRLVAPRVAEALGVPFLDRALPKSLADASVESERANGFLGSLARASTMLAGEAVDDEIVLRLQTISSRALPGSSPPNLSIRVFDADPKSSIRGCCTNW